MKEQLYAVWSLDPDDCKSWLRVGHDVLPWKYARHVAAQFYVVTLRRTVLVRDGINPNLITPAWLKRLMERERSANAVKPCEHTGG